MMYEECDLYAVRPIPHDEVRFFVKHYEHELKKDDFLLTESDISEYHFIGLYLKPMNELSIPIGICGYYLYPGRRIGYLVNLFVIEAFRRKGYANILIKQIEEISKFHNMIKIVTHARMTSNQIFKKRNWALTHEIREFFIDDTKNVYDPL